MYEYINTHSVTISSKELVTLKHIFDLKLNYPSEAVHKVRHAIFGQFLPPLCHTLLHIPGPPVSTSHISDPPIFSRPSTKNPGQKPLVQIISQLFAGIFVQGVLLGGLLSGRFCPEWFLSIHPSFRIHLLQQKVKHHFKFHVSYV